MDIGSLDDFKVGRFVLFMSLLFHPCHSSGSLSLRGLAPRLLNNCPRYSQNPFYSAADMSYSAEMAGKMDVHKVKDDIMMAAVIYEAGGPEVFKVEKRRMPKPVND